MYFHIKKKLINRIDQFKLNSLKVTQINVYGSEGHIIELLNYLFKSQKKNQNVKRKLNNNIYGTDSLQIMLLSKS